MRPKWASLLNEVGIAVETAEKRAEIAEAAKEAAEADREAEKTRADVQQKRSDALQADNAELTKRAREAHLDLKIERELRHRDEAVIEQFKSLVNEQIAAKHRAEDAKIKMELELAVALAEIERLKEALEEEGSRHAITEDNRDSLQKDLYSLKAMLEEAEAKILKLEADKSLNKRLVDEHLFCEWCDRPYRTWDGKRWICLECGR